MHLPMRYPTTPLGCKACKWGFTRHIDMKQLLRYGEFDNPSIAPKYFTTLCQIPNVATGANGGDLTQ